MTSEEILKEYPQLAPEDVLACIAYGSEMTRERTVHIALGPVRVDLDENLGRRAERLLRDMLIEVCRAARPHLARQRTSPAFCGFRRHAARASLCSACRSHSPSRPSRTLRRFLAAASARTSQAGCGSSTRAASASSRGRSRRDTTVMAHPGGRRGREKGASDTLRDVPGPLR